MKAFHYELFFEDFNLIFFTVERLAWLQVQPKQQRFGGFWGTFFTLFPVLARVILALIGQLHDDVILLQLPESSSLLFSCAN